MNLNKAIQKNLNIIVEFYTDWNASSFIISELLKQLQRDYTGHLEIFFINADESKRLCTQYGIQKIPTLVFFKHGKVVKTLKGTASRSDIINVIETLLVEKE